MAFSTTQTPFSSASDLTPNSWDVFLSFRGEDTGLNFTSHLYSALDSHGVRTFKDDPELRTGETISESLILAIQESKTYVVVLSQNYASSRWCLDELAEIYNCHKTKQRLVIPVFYNIDSSVVQHQSGSFKKAFKKFETRAKPGFLKKAFKKYGIRGAAAGMDDVNRWRFILTKLAGFPGETVSAQRSEFDIINQVVHRVVLEIKPMTLDVAKYPVGLESRVEDITALMSSDTKGVVRIGIHGMGGVGKTTLAKAVYNENYHRFQGSCFLENVREASVTKRGLLCLQQKLVNDVLKSKNINIDNVDQGIELIRARIYSMKVLIVIDDLDDPRLLEFLVAPFASGSIIVVTTRNEDLLDAIRVEARYKAYELGDDESRQLFTRHALGDNKISNRFTELSQEILKRAGGLPLALEVFGSNFCNKSEEEWICIDKLKQVSIDHVEKKLVISFDVLKLVDPMLQEIFLDIACFFIGRKKEEAVKIMETCYTFVNRNIEILKKRCLVTINYKDELGMHDLLVDMGREIVRKNSPDEPEKHSRLWVSKDICDVLKNHKGTSAIEGIIPSNFEYQDALEGVSFNTDTFKRMSNLRFLYFEKVNLTGSFEQIFEDLRWLCWEYCPWIYLPSDFHPQKLVFLALPHSKMRTMWEINMASHVFEKLTTLDMSYSLDLSTTPDFTKLPCLETLDLKGCKSLKEVDISIGCLERLVSLNLRGCVNLTSLPDSICILRALKSLNIGGCSRLEALPIELGNIESLTELNAWGLTLSELPDSIGRLSKLVDLNLSDKEYNEAPSSSASTFPSTRWDVFLSFRGTDTRHTFTNHLYSALDRHGVRTFMDDPELSSGEIISDALGLAIQESKTYIVVLSENFASSHWCLDDLVEIVNCHKTMERLLIPVFYNIDASVVRYQTGSFSKAFEKHQIRFSGQQEKVNNWRITLSEVANMPGKHISRERHETDIINEIIHEILLQINPKSLYVAKYPVGLDSRVKGITTLLRSEGEGVTRIGIYGMGGVGKTTLAKSLYNQLLLRGSFTGSCFLANVREVSGTAKGVVSLQQQLIDDVLESKEKVEVHSVEEGTMLIRKKICSAKVLVVIDDIDHHKQYESLVGPFASGSVVIITTRDEEILNKIEVEPRYRYRVNELDDYESLALFTQHAFGKAKPNNTLMVLSKDILHHANGLPLALEVLGSYLSRQHEAGWKFFIKKLQQIPNSTIQQRLVISFDALKLDHPVLQDIFLDIACFFTGRKKDKVVKIMESYFPDVDHNIDILKKRCLLTINKRNELGMHNLLRGMGREIVRNNSPNEPGKHSRLWASEDICDVLKNHKGTEAIEGIVYSSSSYQDALEGVSFTTETFKRMRKLRFLYLKNVNLTGNFEKTLDDLRWLRWEWCPLKCLPSDFYFRKLVILELPRSKMRTAWELNMVFKELKTLNMKFSQDLTTTPDYTKLPNLESLNLEGCESLEELHSSIGSLVRLVSLNLRGCVKLKGLPDTICNLRALEVLDIHDCCSLEALPTTFGNVESLKELNAERLTVSILPDSIGRLSNLVELRLSSNKNLSSLPDTICNLQSLEILDISGCEKLKIPDQLWKLTRLRDLNAGGSTLLKKLPHIESSQIAFSLRNLDLSKNVLTVLPSGISQLSNLESLDLKNCHHLAFITQLPPNLKWIRASGCTHLGILPNLSFLKKLDILDLTDCSGLIEIKGLDELTSIRVLCLTGCNSSLLAYTFTRRFFQIFSGLEHQINIYTSSAEFPDWISQSPNWKSQSPDWNSESSNLGSTMSLDMPPNVSHDLLGMILGFKHLGEVYRISYTTKSDFIWSDSLYTPDKHESSMVIVPRSILSIRDGDNRIELRTTNAYILGIRLLYKIDNKMTDEYYGTIVNVKQEEEEEEEEEEEINYLSAWMDF